MAGYHIAEALRIPYFRAFTMTWTRTRLVKWTRAMQTHIHMYFRAYPHSFAVPERKVSMKLVNCCLLLLTAICCRWAEVITTWYVSILSDSWIQRLTPSQSYVMFEQVFWRAIAGQINRWRRNTLNLDSTSLDKMEPHRIPFLYNFSPHVVPPPLDWPEWIRVTGQLVALSS